MIHRYIVPAALVAVLASGATADAQRCGDGGVRVGDLGFDQMGGAIIHMGQHKNERPQVYFEGEPRIGRVRRDGPAAGSLRDGDVIAAIDGQRIATEAGSRAYSAVDPGDRVRLSIRRGGQVRDVTVVAGARCAAPPPEPPLPPAAPRPVAEARRVIRF
ncbi:PDZ domain-containing protein [Longimicrobium sp.]|uniref:PDZ domain-containing protein n=1 Tax=Longimicrobium sp. TaxID=2029185 RepID=UPI002E30413A|nr:PDZ domain-containing protein [Longimicrobium sp.]HEX6041981.1 PDZ domain-containing protein [Longimicrobium sp.]